MRREGLRTRPPDERDHPVLAPLDNLRELATAAPDKVDKRLLQSTRGADFDLGVAPADHRALRVILEAPRTFPHEILRSGLGVSREEMSAVPQGLPGAPGDQQARHQDRNLHRVWIGGGACRPYPARRSPAP